MPSAGADPLVLTVTTSDGFADVKFTVNSNGRSYAVTRTRADPTVLSLCSSTVALPVASATTLTERPLPCPVAMRVPAEVSNLNVRCCVVPPGRFSIAVIAADEKPSAGMDVRSTATSKTSDCLSATNAIWKSCTVSSAVMRTYAVPGESLRSSATTTPLAPAVSVTERDSVWPEATKVPVDVSNFTAR